MGGGIGRSSRLVTHAPDEVLGPPLCRIYERSALGPLPLDAPRPPSIEVFARVRQARMLGWWARGLDRPTPSFDDRTKAPRVVPRVLYAERARRSLTPSQPR